MLFTLIKQYHYYEFYNALNEYRSYIKFMNCLYSHQIWSLHHSDQPIHQNNVDNDEIQYKQKQWQEEDIKLFHNQVYQLIWSILSTHNNSNFLKLIYYDQLHIDIIEKIRAKILLILSFILLGTCVEMEYKDGLNQLEQLIQKSLKNELLPQDIQALLNEIKRNK